MNFWSLSFKKPLAIKFALSNVILTAMGISIYFASVASPFLYDDKHSIVNNPYIQKLSEYQEIIGIQRIFSRSFLLLTYALNIHLGGYQPFSFHLLNSLLHVCTGILLFFLSCELLEKENPEIRSHLKKLPLVTSLIYVLNPINVEAVVYLSSRSSLLATFLYLATTLTFVRWKKNSRNKSLWMDKFGFPFILIVLLFLGFGTKAILVTMPIMAIAFLWIFNNSYNWKKILFTAMPVLICLFIYLIMRQYQSGNSDVGGIQQFLSGNIFILRNDPFSLEQNRLAYFFTQFEVLVYYYALKLFLPINLNFEPDFRLINNFFNFKFFSALAIFFVILTTSLKSKSRIAKFGLVWIILTLAPTSTFIPLKQISTEHRLYLPAVGFCLVISTIWLNTVRFLRIRNFLFLITLLLMGVLTINRTLDFKTEVLIWKDVVNKSPNKVLAHNNLAIAFLNRKMSEEAEKHLKIALKLNPAFKSAYLNLGHILFKRKKYLEAKKYFDLAIFYGEDSGLIFYNAGLTLIALNRIEESVNYFKKAISKKPENPNFHYALGNTYNILKLSDEAIYEYKKTLNLDPKNLSAQNNIGVVFFENKMYRFAEKAFLKTLQMNNKHAVTYNNLATLYAKTGKYELAIKNLNKYLTLKPLDFKKAEVLNTLKKLSNRSL